MLYVHSVSCIQVRTEKKLNTKHQPFTNAQPKIINDRESEPNSAILHSVESIIKDSMTPNNRNRFYMIFCG